MECLEEEKTLQLKIFLIISLFFYSQSSTNNKESWSEYLPNFELPTSFMNDPLPKSSIASPTRQAVTLRYKLSTMCLEDTKTKSITVMEIQP